jgi:hypothetical protein
MFDDSSDMVWRQQDCLGRNNSPFQQMPTSISRGAIVVKVPPIAMCLTTIMLSPFSSAWINGDRDNLAISGVAVLDMSLAIPLASKNLPAGATLPLMTHLRPPFDSKVDAHRLCRFLVLVTFFDAILKATFQKYKLYNSSIHRA